MTASPREVFGLEMAMAGASLAVQGDGALVAACRNRLHGWARPPANRSPLGWTIDLVRGRGPFPTAGLDASSAPQRWSFGDEAVHCELDLTARQARAEFAEHAAKTDSPRRRAALDLVLRNVVTTAHLVAGGVALHASAVAVDDRAWVFVGPSGAGKSTLARLARESVGAAPLADDLVLLSATRHGARLVRTPDWERETQFQPSSNGNAELLVAVAAVFVLAKGTRLKVRRLEPGQSLAALLCRPVLNVVSDSTLMASGRRVLASLPGQRVWRVEFPPEAAAIKPLFAQLPGER